MNARLPLTIARALVPMAPPCSVVHDIVREADLLEADRYLAGPAHDPKFFNRRAELYDAMLQRDAERLHQRYDDAMWGAA